MTAARPDLPLSGDLWDRYVRAHRNGIRTRALALLSEFLDTVVQEPQQHRDRFCDWLCRTRYDEHDEDVPVQFPVVRDLLVPYLLRAAQERRVPHLRWLYQIAHSPNGYRVLPPPAEGPPPLFGPMALELSTEIDPNDRASWRLLLDHMLRIMDYGAHHLHQGHGLVLADDICLEALAAAQATVERAPRGMLDPAQVNRFVLLEGAYAGWFSYTAAQADEEFIIWCARRGIDLPIDLTYQW